MIQGTFDVARALAFAREPGEDRVGVFERGPTTIVVVADGAGGITGGARAAELLVELVGQAAASPALDPGRADVWVDVLARADRLLEADREAGETTAVVVAIAEDLLVGASSGDSGAWVVQVGGNIDDLTARQHRKLRVGSGRAKPVSFSRPRLTGTLVVATDGLFNYVRGESIVAGALQDDLDSAASNLIEVARLRGGRLQDDVGVVLVKGRSAG